MNKKKITSVDFDEEKEINKSNVNQDKETKKKSNAQKAVPGMIVIIVTLVIILTCVLIAYYQVYNSGKQNANTSPVAKLAFPLFSRVRSVGVAMLLVKIGSACGTALVRDPIRIP